MPFRLPTISFSLPAVHTSHAPAHSLTKHRNGENWEEVRGVGRTPGHGRIRVISHTAQMVCYKWPFEPLSLWSAWPQNPSFSPLPSFPSHCCELLSCPQAFPLIMLSSCFTESYPFFLHVSPQKRWLLKQKCHPTMEKGGKLKRYI